MSARSARQAAAASPEPSRHLTLASGPRTVCCPGPPVLPRWWDPPRGRGQTGARDVGPSSLTLATSFTLRVWFSALRPGRRPRSPPARLPHPEEGRVTSAGSLSGQQGHTGLGVELEGVAVSQFTLGHDHPCSPDFSEQHGLYPKHSPSPFHLLKDSHGEESQPKQCGSLVANPQSSLAGTAMGAERGQVWLPRSTPSAPRGWAAGPAGAGDTCDARVHLDLSIIPASHHTGCLSARPHGGHALRGKAGELSSLGGQRRASPGAETGRG